MSKVTQGVMRREWFLVMEVPLGIKPTLTHLLLRNSRANLHPHSAPARVLTQGDSRWHMDSLEPSLGTQQWFAAFT